MWYLLLADQHVYRCRTWDALVDKLVWARDQRYATAKARRSSAFTDRPLMPAEAVALVEAATEVVLAGGQVAVGSRGYETRRRPVPNRLPAMLSFVESEQRAPGLGSVEEQHCRPPAPAADATPHPLAEARRETNADANRM